MNTLTQLKDTFNRQVGAGESTFNAARAAEDLVISNFRDQQRRVLRETALGVFVSATQKDRSKGMKIIHSAAKLLNANAQAVNAPLEAFAAAMTPQTGAEWGRKAWTAKIQHGLTVRTQTGDKTKMETGGVIWVGHDNEDVTTALMSFTKEDWGKQAANYVQEKVEDVVDHWLTAPGRLTHEVFDGRLVIEPGQYGHKYSGKTIWRVLGAVSFKSALFEANAVALHGRSEEGFSELGYTTRRIERLKVELDQMLNPTDMDGRTRAALAGNAYADDKQDELTAAQQQLDTWELAHTMWKEVEQYVLLFNSIQEWMGADLRMPVADLKPYEERKAVGIMERLKLVEAQGTDYIAGAAKSQAEAQLNFNNILA